MSGYYTPFKEGVSTLGNTLGTTGTVLGQVVLVGGDNITLSQSISGQRASITISGGAGGAGGSVNFSAGTTSNNLASVVFSNSNGLSFGLNGSTITGSYTVPTVPAQFSGGNSNIGNTSGDTGVVTGRLVLAGGNNVTLSGSTNAGSMTITISGGVAGGADGFNIIAAGTQTAATNTTVLFENSNGITFGMSGSSRVTASYTVPTVTNSSWTVSDNATSGTVARLAFTNLNGVTLSLSTGAGGSHTIVGSHNAITSQSTDYNAITLGGNTAGTTTFHATNNRTIFLNGGNNITLSGNGSTITISAFNQSAESQSIGMNTSTAGGATGGTSGYASGAQVRYDFYAGSNITLSQSVNAASGSLSIYGPSPGGGGAQTLSFYQNLEPGSTANSQPGDAFLFLTPLQQADFFPGVMSVSTVLMNFTGSVSTGAAFTRSLSLGFYTMVNSTQLSLAFSASTSWGTNAANMNVNDSMAGYRWVSFNSSQFNNAPNFSQTMYWIAHWNRSSGGTQTFSMFGNQSFLHSTTRSGTMSAASVTNLSLKWYPFLGGSSVSFTTAMPNALDASNIVANAAPAIFVPHVVFNNLGASIV